MSEETSKTREFIFSLEAKDVQGILRKGNFFLVSNTGKITRENVEFIQKKWIESIVSTTHVGINIENCMILSIFELDS